MSIEQTDVVDAIGIEVRSGKVVLTISDHLDWSDEHAHLLALQSKVNTYARFVESGELLSSYPDAAGRVPVIDVVARVEPTHTAVQFFDKVRCLLNEAGIELRFRVLPE
jgi:hypothetical protein